MNNPYLKEYNCVRKNKGIVLFFVAIVVFVSVNSVYSAEINILSLKQEAEHGSIRAQEQLGRYYYYGKYINKDYQQAAKWFLKAAEQGDPDAQYSLGILYSRGHGVSQDYKKCSIGIQKPQVKEWLKLNQI